MNLNQYEKDINKYYSEQQYDVDVDDLWSDFESRRTKKSNSKYIFFTIILSGLFVAFAWLGYLYLQPHHISPDNTSDQNVAHTEVNQNEIMQNEIMPESASSANDEVHLRKEAEIKNLTSPTAQPAQEVSASLDQSLYNNATSLNAVQSSPRIRINNNTNTSTIPMTSHSIDPAHQNTLNDNLTPSSASIDDFGKTKKSNNIESSQVPLSIDKAPIGSDNQTQFDRLSMMPIRPIHSISDHNNALPILSYASTSKPVITSNRHWQIGLSTGVFGVHSSLSSDQSSEIDYLDIRKQSESNLLSFSSGIQIRNTPKSTGFYFESGINHVYRRVKMDHTIGQARLYDLEDVVIAIQRNASTGELSEIRGDVTVQGFRNTRTIRYNIIQYLELPLRIGYIYPKSSFKFEPSAGLLLGSIISQNGKIVNETGLAYQDLSQDKAYSSNILLKLEASFAVSYSCRALNSDLYLQPSIMYQVNSTQFNNSAISEKPIYYGINLGIRYNL